MEQGSRRIITQGQAWRRHLAENKSLRRHDWKKNHREENVEKESWSRKYGGAIHRSLPPQPEHQNSSHTCFQTSWKQTSRTPLSVGAAAPRGEGMCFNYVENMYAFKIYSTSSHFGTSSNKPKQNQTQATPPWRPDRDTPVFSRKIVFYPKPSVQGYVSLVIMKA